MSLLLRKPLSNGLSFWSLDVKLLRQVVLNTQLQENFTDLFNRAAQALVQRNNKPSAEPTAIYLKINRMFITLVVPADLQ